MYSKSVIQQTFLHLMNKIEYNDCQFCYFSISETPGNVGINLYDCNTTYTLMFLESIRFYYNVLYYLLYNSGKIDLDSFKYEEITEQTLFKLKIQINKELFTVIQNMILDDQLLNCLEKILKILNE